jgi:predicted RNA binding protein YcfA (HicA-like mRNA interferase family)
VSLRPLPAGKVIKVLFALGFEIVRRHGSHIVLKHAGEKIGVGLILKIIKDVKVSKEDFLKLLENV